MGNEQSTPNPRRSSNKLSKPRTNSNANVLTSTSKSVLTSASRASFSHHNSHSDDVVDQLDTNQEEVVEDGPEVEKEKERPELAKRSSKRMSLQIFRSRSSRTQPDIAPEQDVAADVDMSISSARASRSNSMACESVTESTQSKTALEKPLFRRARMSLQHIPHSHKTRLSLVAEVKTPEPDLFPTFESSPLNEDADETIDPSIERKSTPNAHNGIRRRSMVQHGIATRTTTSERYSGESYSDELRKYYYNPAKPTSSPLSDLAALRSSVESTQRAESMQRAETPTEFRHLGAFKLGSLRITNGDASPSSSVASMCTDDYVSVDTAEVHRLPPRSQTYSVPPQPKKVWARAQSPLRHLHLRNPPDLTIDVPDPSLALFRFNDDTPRNELRPVKQQQQDNALSPFSFTPSPRISPGLEATSKHTAIEDDLFEIEAASPIQSSEFMDPGARSSYEYGRRSVPPAQLAKADSGYSSNVSLRSLDQDRSPTTMPPPEGFHPNSWTNTPRDSSHPTVSKSRNSLPALVTSRSYQPPVFSSPAVPQLTPQPNSGSPPATVGVRTVIQTTFVPPNQDQYKRQKSLPSNDASRRHLDNGSRAKVTTPSASRWRMLRKKSSQNVSNPEVVFTVKADLTPPEGYFVPRVSAEASKHLDAQVEEFPTNSLPNIAGEPVTNSLPASHEAVDNTVIQGSAEARRDELRRARRLSSSAQDSPNDGNHLVRKPQLQSRSSQEIPRPGPGSTKYRHRASLPAQPPTRYQNQEEFITDITSYDTVSSSLGWSSYDVATYAADTEPSKEVQAKIMTSQLEASAAARFARARAEHLDFLQELRPPPSSTTPKRQPPQPRRLASLGAVAAASTPDLHASVHPVPPVNQASRRNPPVSLHTNPRPPIRHSRSTPNTPPGTSHSNASAPTLPLPKAGPAKPMSAEAWAAQATYWRSQRELAVEEKGQFVPARKSTDSQTGRAPLQRPSMSRLNHRVSFDTFGTYNRPVDEARQYYGEEQTMTSNYYENDCRHPLQVPRSNGGSMLVMDRYSGGGLVGDGGKLVFSSAGLGSCVGAFSGSDRKSVHASKRYGVDLSDVPVFELEA